MNMNMIAAHLRKSIEHAKQDTIQAKKDLYINASNALSADTDEQLFEMIRGMNALIEKLNEAETLLPQIFGDECIQYPDQDMPEFSSKQSDSGVHYADVAVTTGAVNQNIITFNQIVDLGLAAVGDVIEVEVPFTFKDGKNVVETSIMPNRRLKSRKIMPRLCKECGIESGDIIRITKIADARFRISIP